ncbi:MAG TPA: arginine deiminase-related protein [Chitinophagales bacterium]|nr:arginine deiminase-related protein [Chitinophagales bacterium]HRK28042.1 arginine deiminase-related protein [Chitinophagales bacterium]
MTHHQTTQTVLMVRPVKFGFNEQTAVTNSFQSAIPQLSANQVQDIALLEFDNFVAQLRALGIDVLVFNDTPYPHTPDSIFPNNWLSTHQNGTVCTYSMKTPNRRAERREEFIAQLSDVHGFTINKREHFEHYETEGLILEGTGSMVLDRVHQIVYAAVSERTNPTLVMKWAERMNYKQTILFTALDAKGAIYHTNVVMCIGDGFAALGSHTIPDARERMRVIQQLENTGHEVIEVNNNQLLQHYAGNMLQLRNNKGEKVLVLSQQAYDSLDHRQIKALQRHNDHLLTPPIHLIETIGGGSVRCMLCEVFLQKG